MWADEARALVRELRAAGGHSTCLGSILQVRPYDLFAAGLRDKMERHEGRNDVRTPGMRSTGLEHDAASDQVPAPLAPYAATLRRARRATKCSPCGSST